MSLKYLPEAFRKETTNEITANTKQIKMAITIKIVFPSQPFFFFVSAFLSVSLGCSENKTGKEESLLI